MRAKKSLQLQMIILLQRLSVIPILKILILIQIQIPNRNQIIPQIKMAVIQMRISPIIFLLMTALFAI